MNREIAGEILQMTGAKVEASPEGLYDLVFMDIQMPVMNGHIAKPLDMNKLNDVLESWL